MHPLIHHSPASAFIPPEKRATICPWARSKPSASCIARLPRISHADDSLQCLISDPRGGPGRLQNQAVSRPLSGGESRAAFCSHTTLAKMATQLVLPSLARCGASHCQPSSSGRQAAGAVPVAPPCKHGVTSASLGGLPRRALLVARQPPKPVTLAPHLQLGCGSASRRRQRASRTGSLHCCSSTGVAQPGEVRYPSGTSRAGSRLCSASK